VAPEKKSTPQGGKPATAETSQDNQNSKGMWDVAYALAHQFPKLAVLAVFLILSYFGIKEILDQRDRAQAELNEARRQIDEIRRDADKVRQDAFVLIKEAHSQKVAAIEALKLAEIASERAVQEKLIETSSRIQTLVSGQIQSMEALEKLRATTANEMSQQITDLRTRRKEMEEELKLTRANAELAQLNFALTQLGNSINNDGNDLIEKINLVSASFKSDDLNSVSFIEQEIKNTENPNLRLSLLYVLYEKLNTAEHLKQFKTHFSENTKRLNVRWVEQFFGTYGRFSDATWYELYESVANATADSNLSFQNRYALTEFFDVYPKRWTEPLFFSSDLQPDDQLWDTIEFLCKLTLEPRQDVPDYYLSSAVRRIFVMEPSAFHAVASKIQNSQNYTADVKRQVADILKQSAEEYDILNDNPSQEVLSFWEGFNYRSNLPAYEALNTREKYISTRG
jgi:hypothetical protein